MLRSGAGPGGETAEAGMAESLWGGAGAPLPQGGPGRAGRPRSWRRGRDHGQLCLWARGEGFRRWRREVQSLGWVKESTNSSEWGNGKGQSEFRCAGKIITPPQNLLVLKLCPGYSRGPPSWSFTEDSQL